MLETGMVHGTGGQLAMGHGRGTPGPTGLRHLAAWVRSLGAGILGFIGSIAHGLKAYRRCQMLEMMSDAELARIGIDRRDIMRHVMLGPQQDHGSR